MFRNNKLLVHIFLICLLSQVNSNNSYAVTVDSNLRLRAKTNAYNLTKEEYSKLLIKIEQYIDNDQDTKAMIELNQLMAQNSSDPAVYVLSARLLRKNVQYKDAESNAMKAIQLNFKYSEAYNELGNIYYEWAKSLKNEDNNNLQKSLMIKSFDNYFMSAQYNPANALPHIGLANAYYANGQLEKSKDEILKAKDLAIYDAEANYQIANYYFKLNDLDRAEKYFVKSLENGMDGKYSTYFLLATIYENNGKIKDAQKFYLKTLKIKPDHLAAQKKLDGLIKISYKDTTENRQQTTKDLFTDINEELGLLMKAENYIVLDELTKARNLLIELLEKNPKNINASIALAELYYTKWSDGFTNSVNFAKDAAYVLNTPENNRSVIALQKFKMINKIKMPEDVRRELINLSISETFDFYDLVNELRAEFLIGNFAESSEKLRRVLDLKLSNFEKFKILKYLCFDHNFHEAMYLIKELQKTYYHNEEIKPIENRLISKLNAAEEKLSEAKNLFELEDYTGAGFIYREIIRYFPTFKPAYLHYSYSLAEQGVYSEALDNIQVYLSLYSLYPDEKPEISKSELKDLIKKYQDNLSKQNKNKD